MISEAFNTVQFNSADVLMPEINQYKASDWIAKVAQLEGVTLESLQYIFCSDEYLLDINRRYLGHDYYTDIITFPYNKNPINGEMYISTERVQENAIVLKVNFESELLRVIIHGLLHLCGHDDASSSQQEKMRALENKYLEVYSQAIK